MVGTPKNPPARHKTFGISDSLLDAVKRVHGPAMQEDIEVTRDPNHRHIKKMGYKVYHDHGLSSTDPRHKENHPKPDVTLHYQRGDDEPSAYTVHKNRAAHGDPKMHKPVKPKTKVGGVQNEDATTDFKKKHSTTVTPGPRKVGGMGDVAIDIKDMSADEFKRKYKMSKSEFQKQEGRMSDYQYNKESWLESLRKVGTDGLIKEESITVQMNPGGTTYKVLSVSKDIGGRIKVGENLTDTHIDDLRDMDISISYKGGKDGKTMKKMESVDVDAKSAASARRHDCASHVRSEEFGEGVCIPTQHADPDEDGQVEWYDVMFDHGIERVMTEKVAIVKSGSHMHSSKKPKGKMLTGSKMKEAVDLDADNVEKMLRHDCASHVKHGEFGEGNCIPGQHTLEETSEGEGIVTHYDVMFDHGVEKDIPVEDLEVIKEMSHGHENKKKSGKMITSNKKKNGNGNGNLDPVDKDELKGKHADREDGDIDNDGDEDDSDKFLHKKRKAISKAIKGKKKNGNGNGDDVEEETKPTFNSIKKSMFKEWVAMGSKIPGNEQVKDAREAYQLAQHYLQLANRDALFANEEKEKTNMKLAKQFYEQYKDLKSKGDESSDDTFKNEIADEKLESFSEAEMPQTTSEAAVQEVSRDTLGSYVRKASDARGHRGLSTKKVDNRYSGVAKASKKIDDMENMPKTQTGSPHKIKPQYNTKTHKLVVKKSGGSVRVVPKDYQLKNDENLAEAHKVDEMDLEIIPMDSTNLGEHAPEVVEYTPHAYDYNRSSWMDALAEVNRYKGRSGHRVTKPEKEGPEHIVMQMRKVMSLGDNHQGVDFGDGTKKKVGKETAAKFLNKYNSSKPADKEKLQRSAAHSHGGLHHAISDKPIEKGPGQPQKQMFKPAARREPTRRLVHPDDRD